MSESRLAQIVRHREKLETEALRLYRPSPQQLVFHQAKSKERIVRGGKRSGKSTSVAMEFTSRVLGIPVMGPDGPLPLQYPVSTPQAPRQYWIIGANTKHAATIHRLLFQRGMGGTMRCIRDAETKEWRIFNSGDPRDEARMSESQLTEPLIPERFWIGTEKETFSWEEKSQWHWHTCKLANGSMLYYWPSSAKNPKQGEAVAGIWIDEDIEFAGHLKEWQDRLTDMRGWFMWSAWPHVKNTALLQLLDRAANEEQSENPRIQQFQLIMSQNPFLHEEGKEDALARMEDEDEIARRDRGEMMLDALAMYNFVAGAHLIKQLPPGEKLPEHPTPRHKLRHVFSVLGGFPREWTRYLSLDPSHTRTAVHSWVVPPVEWEGVPIGNVAICEWELVKLQASADELAAALEPRMSGRHYEAFIMDQMIGRQTQTGRDETTFDAYRIAFEKKGLSSRTTHSGFIPGVNVPQTRYLAMRELLAMQENGTPVLLFVEKETPNTQREFQTYRKKSEEDNEGKLQIYDQPANPRTHDCMASCEYFAAYIKPQFKVGMAYQDPSVYGAKSSPILARMQKIREQYEQQSGGSYVHLGPGASA